MSNRVHCQNCGGRVDVPAGYPRAKIRCPGCGYYAEVPPEMRTDPGEAPPERPAAPPPVVRARRATPAPSPPPPPAEAEPAHPGLEEGYGFSGPASPPPPILSAPKPAAARRAKPQTDPRDHRPKFDPDGPAGPPLLDGTQDEDDDRPYAVPGTGLKNCPHCRGELPLDADFCVHCGRELTSGAKALRSFQPINRTWVEGWPTMLRVQIFIALQVVNAAAAVLLMATGEGMPKDFGGFATLLMTSAFQIGLQAFLIGSYDALTVKRSAKGQATVTRTRRVAFYPLPPTKLPWRQSTNVGIAGTDVGWFPRLLCLYFLFNGAFYVLTGVFYSPFMLGLAVIYFAVGVGFYWVVLRPERFEVNLCDVYGSTDEVAFRCQSRQEAEDVATTVAEATGLFYKPAM